MEAQLEIKQLKNQVARLTMLAGGVEKMFFKSKKFLACVAGVLFLSSEYCPNAEAVSLVLAGYIIGQGLADFGKNKK